MRMQIINEVFNTDVEFDGTTYKILDQTTNKFRLLTTIENKNIEALVKSKVFAELQTAKISEIKQSFTTATKSGYTCTNGITMDADLTSIQTLKSGYDLAVKLGATTMDITDYNNIDHLALPIADVDTMLTELGVNYNTLRVKKNTLKKQAESAKTQAKLDLVVW